MIGSKSKYQPLKSWLDSWSPKSTSIIKSVIIHGESGVGKTTLAFSFSHQSGFEPELILDVDNKHPFSKVTQMSLNGKPRIAIIDDGDMVSKKQWKKVSDFVDKKIFPIVIIIENFKSIPYELRRQCLSVEVDKPSQENLYRFLKSKTSDFDESHLRHIAKVSPTWRSAELNLLTSPNGFKCEEEIRQKLMVGAEESQSILSGKYVGNELKNHPLNLIQMAEYNHAPTEHIITAMKIHSESWNYAGLSRILKDFILTLRTHHQEPVPFRKSKFIRKGSKI
tara:strand:+ start:1565 stop:2404 length:840 start_codon:yes stop_codon:yes gene_type:complete